ncbi:MAG: hypothetical protein EOO90_20495 [Pedobacter sp.]|nr:MAG: hypothetical protein EOO90_20495 [Pedobacter sp.]
MELEEMKNAWNELNAKVEKQYTINNQLIEKMTREKYNSKLNKIGYSEYIGTIICYIGAGYLGVNIAKIEDLIMQTFAMVSITLLLVLPVISLKSLRAIKRLNINSKTYVEAINDFVKQKISFQKLQKLNVALALFLLVTLTPVLAAIQGKDINQINNFWTLIFPLSVLFFSIFALWVLRSYDKVLSETEKILADIDK